ncbi:glutamine synthetase/guanido kinase [Clavulina sp. PMI_390]|nr:glutamine synthetase/guanido kinase [Clavulina sp. PMI_390]
MSDIDSLPHIPLVTKPSETAQRPVLTYNYGYEYVRLIWVDYANNPRCRILPWRYYKQLLESSDRPGVSIANALFGYVGGHLAPGFGAQGNWHWVPDHNSLRVFPTEKNVVTVFGWFQEVNPSPGARLGSLLCPRYILHRTLQYAREVAQIEFLVGFETEFILLSSTDPITAVNPHGYCDTLKTPSGSIEAVVMRNIADNLNEACIPLQMYHAEAAPGQYEVVTGPLSPLEAADALVATREIIMNTASVHKLRATLSPRVYDDAPGSAAHAHISVKSTSPDESNPSELPNLSSVEASFLESVLKHLPAIQAFSMPLPASYLRMLDGIWSGGTYVYWGSENKEAPVRLVAPHDPSSRRFEFKCVDGLSNPYLVLAAVVAAGAQGVIKRSQLTVKELATSSAAEISPAERKALGITQRMSLSVDQARDALNTDNDLRKLLGGEFVKAYLDVNKTLLDWTDEDPATSRKRYVENW